MSAIASFHLLHRSAVPGLVQAATASPAAVPAGGRRWTARLRDRIGWRVPTSPVTVPPVASYLDDNDLGVPDGWDDYSGWALMYLMFLLEDTGTALGTAEYRAESDALNAAYDLTYLITSADKRHLAALDPARLDRAAAERFFDAEGYGFEGIEQAIDDGLTLLHRLIAALDDNEVLVIHIG